MVVKSLDDDDSSDDKLNGIQKVSYLLGVKRFAIGVTCSNDSSALVHRSIVGYRNKLPKKLYNIIIQYRLYSIVFVSEQVLASKGYNFNTPKGI